ncbi:protein FAM168A isoform X2 [Chamaea fasciata]|uniref:protein FAM168A isoform X2 n=1 Tax=Chamaea fasciata TaxID=190680 RepID=UPI00336A5260
MPGAVVPAAAAAVTVPLVVLPPLPPPIPGWRLREQREEEEEEREREICRTGTGAAAARAAAEPWNAVKTPCPGTLLSGLSPSQGSSYPREFPVFHHESCLQPRPTWGSLRKPEEHGLYRLSNRLSHRRPSLQSQHVSNQQPRLRPSHTSDEAGLAPDLLVLCHRGHLPPPGGHRHREQNLPGFFCSIQVHCGDSLQGATDPE